MKRRIIMDDRKEPLPRIIASNAGREAVLLDAALMHIPAGIVSHVRGSHHYRLGMHFGPAVRADCSVGGLQLKRLQKAGDIDFVPAGVDGSWLDDADCRILRLNLHPLVFERVCEELGRDLSKINFIPRLQLRDARIEAIGWAIKGELEADNPSDPLFMDLLANALAVRLIETTTDGPRHIHGSGDRVMPPRRLKQLMEFIEENLDRSLHLADLAKVAGVGVTRLKSLFRASTGIPVHQYVIRRRVEQARALIATTKMPASEVAIACGFANQSHMTSAMQRILGKTPGALARERR